MTDTNDERENAHLIGNDHAVGNSGGAPKGNQNAEGNPGGAPPENNQNNSKHHLYSDRSKLFQWLEENDPTAYQWILDKHESYMNDAPFSSDSAKSDKLLETCVCEYIVWQARGVQVVDGIVMQTHVTAKDGSMKEVTAERPENQAVNRMDRQVMSKLKKLGIFDSNESTSDGKQTMESDDYTITISEEEVPTESE